MTRLEQEAGMAQPNRGSMGFQEAVAQRAWVGLTDEDEIDWDGGDLKSLIKAIEAILKEKNT